MEEKVEKTVIEPAKIVVRHYITYGQHYFQPVNELALKLLNFVQPKGNRKAFTEKQIKLAKELGMIIEILPMINTGDF